MPALPERTLSLPPSADNPRNSEGSFVRLADGRTLFVYSCFAGGARDDSSSSLACVSSPDDGRTWGPPQMFLPNEGMNTMSVSFLRLADGAIGLWYLVREEQGGQQSLRVMMRRSTDEAATWSEPTCCSGEPSYTVVNNDRVIQLTTGRLVIPTSDHGFFDGSKIGVGRARCFLSDDSGRTWRSSATVPMPADLAEAHLQEPGVIELRDGSLLMLSRTALGCHYRSLSQDGGETWSVAEPTDLIAPCSPASFKRLPQTGDILIVYNDHQGILEQQAGKRTPLTTALSSDEGQTWTGHRALEDDPDGWYCYTALHLLEDTVLLGYCAGDSQVGGLNRLRATRVPVAWLYGE